MRSPASRNTATLGVTSLHRCRRWDGSLAVPAIGSIDRPAPSPTAACASWGQSIRVDFSNRPARAEAVRGIRHRQPTTGGLPPATSECEILTKRGGSALPRAHNLGWWGRPDGPLSRAPIKDQAAPSPPPVILPERDPRGWIIGPPATRTARQGRRGSFVSSSPAKSGSNADARQLEPLALVQNRTRLSVVRGRRQLPPPSSARIENRGGPRLYRRRPVRCDDQRGAPPAKKPRRPPRTRFRRDNPPRRIPGCRESSSRKRQDDSPPNAREPRRSAHGREQRQRPQRTSSSVNVGQQDTRAATAPLRPPRSCSKNPCGRALKEQGPACGDIAPGRRPPPRQPATRRAADHRPAVDRSP